MDSTGITPVMPMGGDGFGNGGFMWIFGLLILMGMFNGGFGFGGGAAEQYATRDQVQNGFDTQNMLSQTRDILAAVNAGTAQSVAASNQVYHDVVSYVGDKYSELARDVAGLAVQNAQTIANQNECCCSTKLLITETTGNLAAQIAQNKYENALALAGMEQRITAKMDANEITALRDQVQQLQLAQATAGVLRYPTTWTYAAGQFPPVAGTAA